MQKFPFFNFLFDDMELERQFEEWINNNALEIFSQVERAGVNYDISYINAKAIVNKSGAYKQILKETMNNINTQPSNNSSYAPFHISAELYNIHRQSGGGFVKLINTLKRYNALIEKESYQFNVVWYDSFREGVKQI